MISVLQFLMSKVSAVEFRKSQSVFRETNSTDDYAKNGGPAVV